MFLLKTNGKKWSNSEVSVLQGNRGRFTWYLTQCLKHTAVFPHEFYSPKHSEEHTPDNNTHSIIHSVPNFISSPLFLNVRTHAVHVPSPCTTHTYKMRGGVASLQADNLNMRRAGHTLLTHTWNRGETHPNRRRYGSRRRHREWAPSGEKFTWCPSSAEMKLERRVEGETERRPHFIILEGDRTPRGTE